MWYDAGTIQAGYGDTSIFLFFFINYGYNMLNEKLKKYMDTK